MNNKGLQLPGGAHCPPVPGQAAPGAIPPLRPRDTAMPSPADAESLTGSRLHVAAFASAP